MHSPKGRKSPSNLSFTEAHLEWEEANWHNVVDNETKEEQNLQQEEIEWLNEWVKKTD